jgi:hypothetical protein
LSFFSLQLSAFFQPDPACMFSPNSVTARGTIYSFTFQSLKCEPLTHEADEPSVDNGKPNGDMLKSMKDMYRVLNLVTEHGSGGFGIKKCDCVFT